MFYQNKQSMISLYKVTPAVDSALRMFLAYKTTKDSSEKKILELHMITMFTLMEQAEIKELIKIDAKLKMIFESKNDVKFNTEFNRCCSVFELDEESDVVNLMMWSCVEKPLIDMLKMIKNNFDKNEEVKIEKKEDTWTWKCEGYEFVCDSEYKAYTDAISYMKSVESIVDCLEKQ